MTELAELFTSAPGLTNGGATKEELPPIGPEDFAPYRAEIQDCHCAAFCLPMVHVMSKNSGTYVRTGEGRREHERHARGLLAALVAGTHQRVGFREFVAEAKAEKVRRLAKAKAAGASPETLATIERGYATIRIGDFHATGMGLGIGPRA
jgi:hypothetical protein